MPITVNLTKAKTIAHKVRRAKRSLEFAPLDQLIAKQIPGSDPVAVEISREQIRVKYDEVQTKIDEAIDIETLKTAVEGTE